MAPEFVAYKKGIKAAIWEIRFGEKLENPYPLGSDLSEHFWRGVRKARLEF